MQGVFEKIIKKVKENAYMVVQKNNSKELGMTLCGFEQVINEVSAEYNNGWTPCSERLPERNKPVLCWVISTTIASGETYIIGSCDNGFWFLYTYEIGHHHFPVKDYEVIAWQPLPEPYLPKGE